ncbi:hypothetical protein IAU59_004988 [Kwoniella sp. CBS 9459]
MPLPTSGAIPFVTGNETQAGSSSKPAYLIKFPEEIWDPLQNAAAGGGGGASGSGMTVSVAADGRMTLNIPNLPPIPLDSRSTGATASEIHTYNPSAPSLSLSAVASTRLSIPLSSASTARAADKLKAQSEAIERERKERAIRVEGSAPPANHKNKSIGGVSATLASSTGMGRTHSSPQMMASASVNTGTSSGGGQPMIPLKTRVMQLLALGPTTVADIVRRVGGDEQNVMRVVNVVGRASSTHPPTYTLLPNQYSKIKIGPGQWKYTYAEQQQVIRLAREAFDELGLDADAEERVELDRKEQEALNGYHSAASSSSNSGSGTQAQAEKQDTSSQAQSRGAPSATGVATSPNVAVPTTSSTSSKSNTKGKRTDSPAPTASGSTSTATNAHVKKSTSSKSKATGPQSKIARERAKFMAERGRSTSATNARAADGLASPRTAPTPVQTSDTEDKPIKEVKNAKERDKTKQEDKDKEHAQEKQAAKSKNGKRRASTSRDYSSDEEDQDVPERSRDRLVKTSNNGHGDIAAAQDKPVKKQTSPNRPSLRDKVRERDKAKEQQEREKEGLSRKRSHSDASRSSEEEDGAIREDKAARYSNGGGDEEDGEIRGRPKTKINREHQSPTYKRKPPPPELKLNGATPPDSASGANGFHSIQATVPHPASAPLPRTSTFASRDTSTSRRDREPDPESLRERYEELFPAYEQLTRKLAKVHQSAENGGPGLQSLSEEEVSKMVKKWEKWHNELGEIRRWFGDEQAVKGAPRQ